MSICWAATGPRKDLFFNKLNLMSVSCNLCISINLQLYVLQGLRNFNCS